VNLLVHMDARGMTSAYPLFLCQGSSFYGEMGNAPRQSAIVALVMGRHVQAICRSGCLGQARACGLTATVCSPFRSALGEAMAAA
jgi:hypothetical protein